MLRKLLKKIFIIVTYILSIYSIPLYAGTYGTNFGDAFISFEKQTSEILGLNFSLNESTLKNNGPIIKISAEEGRKLILMAQNIEINKNKNSSNFCSPCSSQKVLLKNNSFEKIPTKKNANNSLSEKWEVVFYARLVLHSGKKGAVTLTHNERGIKRFQNDIAHMKKLVDKNKLTNDKMDKIFDNSGAFLKYNSEAAMAYISELGSWLNNNYGDSYAGRFVPRFEQIGKGYAGKSVGQCSDIHFAMLKAYKKLAGKDAKAYLVNFQTSRTLHHTNLIIEDKGKIHIVDYRNIVTNEVGSADVLAQNSSSRSGHGLAYRIFTDEGEIDKMVAHIDTPLGKFLREVSTGNTSFNPFERANYTSIATTVKKSGGGAVRLFFGELDQGDALMGVAINMNDIKSLPAGFKLKSYIASSLSYAHRTFITDDKFETLHSGILYLNTGLGVLSPKLELNGISFQAQSHVYLEMGTWIKSYSETSEGFSPFEADGNIINRSRIDLSKKISKNFKFDGNLELSLMPSFKTAFPESSDGSSFAKGLGQTLGIIPNRVTSSINFNYKINSLADIFSGVTYQLSPLGSIIEVNAGASNTELRASAFIRGAISRKNTPIFIPGAERQVGINIKWCKENTERIKLSTCFGFIGSKSLENNSWWANFSGEVKF